LKNCLRRKEENMGGKPKKNTPRDMRLKKNKAKFLKINGKVKKKLPKMDKGKNK
jgi:hypothetical protein